MTMTTIAIPSANLWKAKEKIKSLNNRANKLGLNPLSYTVSEPRMEKRINDQGRKYFLSITDLVISGEIPAYKGWNIQGVIEHYPEGNIVKNISETELSEHWHTAKADCDHCHYDRDRKKTIIINNGTETKQIGASCINAYLEADVIRVLGFLESLGNNMPDDESELFGQGEAHVKTLDALSMATRIVNAIGFVKSNSDEFVPTKVRMSAMLFNPTNKLAISTSQEITDKLTLSDDEIEKQSNDCIQWIQNNDSKSDFIQNLKTIFQMEYIPSKMFGYIAGAVSAYKRHLAESIQRKEYLNEYLDAELKKRITIPVTLESIKTIESFYGTSWIHRFTDADNRLMIWFASANPLSDNVGQSFTIKGTIKKKEEYQGLKQTILNRVTIQ